MSETNDQAARVVPDPSEVSQPFWDATREGRLVLQHCDACDGFVWYPRPFCPGCLRESLEWTEVSGRGLHVVTNLATTWGVEPGATGKTVWFTFELARGYGTRARQR